jgi:hypothetical protein
MGKAAQKRSRCKALWGTPDADAMVDSHMAGRTRQNFSCSWNGLANTGVVELIDEFRGLFLRSEIIVSDHQ